MAITAVGPVGATPPAAPAGYYGSVTTDAGDPVPEGTAIAILVDGDAYDTTTVTAGAYEAYVPSDAGDTVVFEIGGVAAGNATIVAGTSEVPLVVPASALETDEATDTSTNETDTTTNSTGNETTTSTEETDGTTNTTDDTTSSDAGGSTGGGGSGGGSSSGGGGGGGGSSGGSAAAPTPSVVDLTTMSTPSDPDETTYTAPIADLADDRIAAIEAASPVSMALANHTGTVGVGQPISEPGTNRSQTAFASGLATERLVLNASVETPLYAVETTAPLAATGPPPGDALVHAHALAATDAPITADLALGETVLPDDPTDLRAVRYDNGWQSLAHSLENETVSVALARPGPFALVYAPAPTAAIDAPETATAGETIVLSATDAHVGAGEITSYRWRVGDQSFSGPAPVVRVPDGGDLTVTLTVETAAGRSDQVTKTVAVESTSPFSRLPTPGFGVPVTLVALLAFGMRRVRG